MAASSTLSVAQTDPPGHNVCRQATKQVKATQGGPEPGTLAGNARPGAGAHDRPSWGITQTPVRRAQ
jgi:hypothetical protein